MRLKYAVRELTKNFISTIFLMVQLAFVFYTIYSVISINKDITVESKYIGSFFENKKIYNYSFLSDPEVYLKNNKGINEKNLNDIIEYLENNTEFKEIAIDTASLPVESFKNNEEFIEVNNQFEAQGKKFFPTKNVTLSKNYIDEFPLKMFQGRTFRPNEFKRLNDTEDIPIIVGFDYSKLIKVGDYMNILIGEKWRKAKVVGILDENQYVIGNITSMQDKYINLNNRIISATSIYEGNDNEVFSRLCPSNYVMFSDKDSKADINRQLENIKSIFRDKAKIEVNIRDLNKFVASESSEFKKQEKISLVTAIIVLICVGSTLTISILDSINRRKEEYAIHIFSGGRLRDIAVITYLQIFITSLIGYIVSIPLIKLFVGEVRQMNVQLLIYLFIISILLSLILSLIPIIKIMNTSISQLIKGDE